jgi:hypothetical protein
MMRLTLLAIFTLSACTSYQPQYVQGKEMDYETFGQTSHWQSRESKYDDPITFSFYSNVRLTGRQWSNELSLCGQSLKTTALNHFDWGKLSGPFHEIGVKELKKLNANLNDESHMLFSMRWVIKDVPVSLSLDSTTNFCLVQSKIEVGEKFLRAENRRIMELNRILPPQKNDPIFTSEKHYFVTPEYIRTMIENEISQNMQLIVPTLNGEIDDECGYFMINPEDECSNFYRSELRQQKNKLGCSNDDREAEEIRARIKEIEEKQVVYPPKPLQANVTYSDIGVCK